jgi:hypothetical protein
MAYHPGIERGKHGAIQQSVQIFCQTQVCIPLSTETQI